MTIKITKNKIKDICCLISDDQICQINNIVMFVGHAHSGHSLIGALLDSHPCSAISNHVNLPMLLLDHDLSRSEALKIILFYSLENRRENAWVNTGYKYKIKEGQQGHTTHPIVIGDKQGGASTRVLFNNPFLLAKLIKTFGADLKIIFVHRNVFDNIAAYSYYMKEDLSQKHIDRYFKNLKMVTKIKKKVSKECWFELSHENFLLDPLKELSILYTFLDLSIPDNIREYIKIVNTKANNRRQNINWSKEQVESITKGMQIL